MKRLHVHVSVDNLAASIKGAAAAVVVFKWLFATSKEVSPYGNQDLSQPQLRDVP
jgi:hypothetical protein